MIFFRNWNSEQNTLPEIDNQVALLTRQQIKTNTDVFESLKAYDEGKKEIQTGEFKRSMLRIQSSL